jgi:hypothetical protein
VHHHPWQQVDIAVSDATRAIHQALRADAWIRGQRQRLRQLAPGTYGNRPWPACSASAPAGKTTAPATTSSRSRSTPDVIWLTARSLRAHTASHHAAP